MGMKRILVTYWTKTGSTKAVAQGIAEALGAAGLGTELKALDEVGDLWSYDGFVIGAPVNGLHWKDEALAFVASHREVLSAKPTALFLLSIMYGLGRPSARRKALGLLGPAAALIKPLKLGFFGGVMAGPAPGILRLAFGIPKDAPLDSRDWPAIRAWAAELASALA